MIEVSVEKMSLGGSGIARHQGLVLFIPFSAPGDLLKVKINEQKKNFAFAEIVEILQPSMARQTPPCPVYGRCGGCSFQHLKYSEQLKQKQNIVLEQLAKVIGPETEVLPIVPSPSELRYRNRIQVHVQNNKWGYFARRSHELVSTTDCLIAESPLIEELQNSAKKKSDGRYEVSLKKDLSVSLQKTELESEDSENGFSQVNRFQNENLVQTVLNWSESTHPWTEIWDLYAGAGNFSFPLLEKYKKTKLLAVELSASSVQDAQALLRAKNWSPQKVQFFLSDVAFFLKRGILAPQGLILLDPPRNGCGPGVAAALMAQDFSKILYISCNPSTLARDLQEMQKKAGSGIKISRLQAFDMFPQTDHVEVLVEIIRTQT